MGGAGEGVFVVILPWLLLLEEIKWETAFVTAQGFVVAVAAVDMATKDKVSL